MVTERTLTAYGGRPNMQEYKITRKEQFALWNKNRKAVNRPETLERAKRIQKRINEARDICRKEDRKLPRYYDYNAKGELK